MTPKKSAKDLAFEREINRYKKQIKGLQALLIEKDNLLCEYKSQAVSLTEHCVRMSYKLLNQEHSIQDEKDIAEILLDRLRSKASNELVVSMKHFSQQCNPYTATSMLEKLSMRKNYIGDYFRNEYLGGFCHSHLSGFTTKVIAVDDGISYIKEDAK